MRAPSGRSSSESSEESESTAGLAFGLTSGFASVLTSGLASGLTSGLAFGLVSGFGFGGAAASGCALAAVAGSCRESADTGSTVLGGAAAGLRGTALPLVAAGCPPAAACRSCLTTVDAAGAAAGTALAVSTDAAATTGAVLLPSGRLRAISGISSSESDMPAANCCCECHAARPKACPLTEDIRGTQPRFNNTYSSTSPSALQRCDRVRARVMLVRTGTRVVAMRGAFRSRIK